MKYLYFILFLSLFKLFLFDCIPDYNCLKNRGKCINNKCECFEEFWTLKLEDYNDKNFIYCNYERRNRFSLLALEFFIPIGISHILRGRKVLFFLKIFFLCSPIILLFIGFRIFENEDIKENSNNIKNENEEEEINLITNKQKNKDKNKDNLIEKDNEDNKKDKNDSYNSEEGNDNEDFSGIHIANSKRIPLICLNRFLLFLEGFFILCYFIQHIIDLVGYGFGLYRDKGNVPFL